MWIFPLVLGDGEAVLRRRDPPGRPAADRQRDHVHRRHDQHVRASGRHRGRLVRIRRAHGGRAGAAPAPMILTPRRQGDDAAARGRDTGGVAGRPRRAARRRRRRSPAGTTSWRVCAASFRGCRSSRNTASRTDLPGQVSSRSCSTDTRSCSSTTSCSDPKYEAGCPVCSSIADNLSPNANHPGGAGRETDAQCREPRLRSSRDTGSGWVGGSTGRPRWASEFNRELGFLHTEAELRPFLEGEVPPAVEQNAEACGVDAATVRDGGTRPERVHPRGRHRLPNLRDDRAWSRAGDGLLRPPGPRAPVWPTTRRVSRSSGFAATTSTGAWHSRPPRPRSCRTSLDPSGPFYEPRA